MSHVQRSLSPEFSSVMCKYTVRELLAKGKWSMDMITKSYDVCICLVG